MWKLISLAVVLAGTANADPIKFAPVNAVMEAIANAVTQGDDIVETALPKFDESFSDLKAERLRYYLSGVIKNSPWLTGSRSEITAASTLVADRDPKHLGIEVVSSAQIKTDTLAMLREGATIALKKIQGPPPKFEARIIDSLKQLSEVSSLKNLEEILVASQSLAIEIEQDKISHEKEYLECLKAHKCGQNSSSSIEEQIAFQQKYIARYVRIKTALEEVQIIATPSINGVTRLVLVSSDPVKFIEESKQSDFAVKAKKLSLELTDTSAQVELSGFAELKQSRMDELKADLTDCLVRLQNGDLDKKEITFRSFRDALFHFKEVIQGEVPRR